jgi:hypothetical protein
MKVLTIQSLELSINAKTYADPTKCNHPNALEVYQRLFNDYNQKKKTNYNSFFWGFSKLLTDNLEDAIERACGMIGMDFTKEWKVLVLDIPDELCLETDFYNFSDEIYAHQYPDELESYWDYIYEKRESERQVIFPYIDPKWIVQEITME